MTICVDNHPQVSCDEYVYVKKEERRQELERGKKIYVSELLTIT